MRKNIISFVAVSALIFSACAQQKKTTASAKATNTKTTSNGIEKIVMERTPCFGTCPSYRFELNKNGKAIFTSWHYTTYEGVYEKQYEPAKVADLFKQFESYKVDTCSNNYESMLQDMPGINFHFTYKGKESSIMNAHFGPGFLNMLSKEVDTFSQVDGTWKKTADAKKE